MPKLFLFDIDETLLVIDQRVDSLHKKVSLDKALSNPYGEDFGNCYVLNKAKTQELLHSLYKSNCKIGFITNGDITREEIDTFITENYGITLEDDFIHYNQQADKSKTMDQICMEFSYNKEDLILIDNNQKNIQCALSKGYNTLYVDTNKNDNGSNLYLNTLKELVAKALDTQLKEEIDPFFSLQKKSITTSIYLEDEFLLFDNDVKEIDPEIKTNSDISEDNYQHDNSVESASIHTTESVYFKNTNILFKGPLPNLGEKSGLDDLMATSAKECVFYFYQSNKTQQGIERRLKKLGIPYNPADIKIIDTEEEYNKLKALPHYEANISGLTDSKADIISSSSSCISLTINNAFKDELNKQQPSSEASSTHSK